MSLRHRIPVRVRHYWKPFATGVAVLTGLIVLAGNVQVTPIVTSNAKGKTDAVVVDVKGTVDLFDAAVPHTLSLAYAEADYQRMFDEYLETGEKEYVRADLTVDGTLVRDVGIRLKGNSTLMGLTHEGRTKSRSPDRGGAQMPGMPEGGIPGMPEGGMPGGGMRGGMDTVALDSTRPEELPWLISFDEFSDGRRYQGHSEIAVRISGFGGGSMVLNEALSLRLMSQAGETTQRYAYAGLTVNDRPAKARLLVEHPDENFADRLGDGVLYKSLSTGRFTYQGEDPTEYTDDFKQINNTGGHDLKPVIDLVKWANEASDTDFARDLAHHVDVASFARYVALQNLLLNFDDMAGPGRNFYLWYDLDTKKFKVIGWDHNLTFSGSATAGPHDTISMGGMGRPGGFQLPEGMQLPEGFTPPGGGGGPGGGGPGGFMTGNKLKERFLATDAFRQVYEDAYRDLYRKIYAGDVAVAAINAITATLATVPGNDADATKTDADKLRTLVQQRAAALAKDKVITG